MKPYSSIQLAFRYFDYIKKSKTRYRVHSPFVFRLIEDVFRNQPPFYAYRKIEDWRDQLLEDSSLISPQNLGAGSRLKAARTVKQIANRSLTPPYQSEWLFGLVNYFNAKAIVELGTSLGVSTAYLASASKSSTVYTFEGNGELLEVAKRGWDSLKLKNIVTKAGNIDDELHTFLETHSAAIDLVFMDANHTYEATVSYFNSLLPHLNKNAVIIVDDIHWSAGMEKAWEEIINSTEVSISIDLFHKGFLFFRKDIEKEHFVLRV